MRGFLSTILAASLVAVLGTSNALAAPANGAAIIGAAEAITFVEDIAYCTRTDNRGRILSRHRGHCTGQGVTCWTDIPHRSKFLHRGPCRHGEGGF